MALNPPTDVERGLAQSIAAATSSQIERYIALATAELRRREMWAERPAEFVRGEDGVIRVAAEPRETWDEAPFS